MEVISLVKDFFPDIFIIITYVNVNESNCSFSRKWSREQKSVGSPVYGYIQGGIPGTLPGKNN